MQHQTLQSLVPATKVNAVNRALQATFDTQSVDSITPLSGGLSTAFVYKIIVAGKPYVLRLIMHQDALNDPARQFTCMKLAAAVGVAPRVHYASVEDALSIIDFVDAQRLMTAFATRQELLITLANTVKAIHSTTTFPKLVNFLDGVDDFIQEFRAAQMLPESATAELFCLYAQVQQSYPRHDPDVVSSHNDLNYNNILFDGKKIWVIDWEAAFQNDRYADLATIANGFVNSDDDEELFLRAYFGDAPSDYQRARFFLMRQVRHLFYAMIMMKLVDYAKPGNVPLDTNMQVPRIEEFRKHLGDGTIQLGSYQGQLLFAKVEMNEALLAMQSQRFAESVALMGQH